eukprot:CAMPEP_0119503572 /NCGR_PEP_ID=MMETSP1344-20130328/24702_1 /TAXON_ID=236787 /ORGANISM="Florenciella parvula, Strain CCMP2471" /LENGTH=115 /DNA_ID=CAMNT_0007539875 /DNA_START=75 /DNA_END=418 /DNA_ORIENTATION=-
MTSIEAFTREHGLGQWLGQLLEMGDDIDELSEGLTGHEFDQFVESCGMPAPDAARLKAALNGEPPPAKSGGWGSPAPTPTKGAGALGTPKRGLGGSPLGAGSLGGSPGPLGKSKS